MIYKSKKDEISAYNIYAEILEFGSLHLNRGVSLQELTVHLKSLKLYNTGSDEYIRHWFTWSFSHKEEGCKCMQRPDNDCNCDKDDSCNNFDHVLNCSYFLNKDACLDLLKLKESKNNNESAKWSKRNGNIALVIALLSFVSPIIFDIFYNSKQDGCLEKISNNSLNSSNKIDSLILEICKLRNEIMVKDDLEPPSKSRRVK
jgi:hypothetical protein